MSDPDIERKRRFSQAIQRLHAAYGRGVEPHELRAWWALLCPYAEDVIARACDRAMREGDGKYPPTAEQVRRHAAAAAKATPPPGERLALPPGPIAGKAARILDAASPYERLARLWEAEDAHAHRRPTDAIPRDLGQQRLREIATMLARDWGATPQPVAATRTETGLEAILGDSGEQDASTDSARVPGAKSDD